MYADMQVVLFPLRKFQLCAIAVVPGKLRVDLQISDQSHAGSHFNSQNTHSHFRNSHFTHGLLSTTASNYLVTGTFAPRHFHSVTADAVVALVKICGLTILGSAHLWCRPAEAPPLESGMVDPVSPGLFAPQYFRSSGQKFPMITFAPRNEYSVPGIFVPKNFRYCNYYVCICHLNNPLYMNSMLMQLSKCENLTSL